MVDCIYSPHCTYKQCDMACPMHAETSYWMDRCSITMNNSCLKESSENVRRFRDILDRGKGKVNVIRAEQTVRAADLLAYCAICLYGHGTALTGGVYNLNYTEFIDEIKHSWSTKEEDETLQFMRIWSQSATVLVVSHMDYVKFNDFESQTLLTLMQSRDVPEKSTFVVVPKGVRLIGNGSFYTLLQDKMGGLELK